MIIGYQGCSGIESNITRIGFLEGSPRYYRIRHPLINNKALLDQSNVNWFNFTQYMLINDGFREVDNKAIKHPIEQLFIDKFFDIDQNEDLEADHSKLISSTSKNLLIFRMEIQDTINSLATLEFFNTDKDWDIDNNLIIEIIDANLLIIRTRDSFKFLRVNLNNIVTLQGFLEVGIYLCRETNSLVVLRDTSRIDVESMIAVFYDERIKHITRVNYISRDTSGVNIDTFITVDAHYLIFESIGKLKSSNRSIFTCLIYRGGEEGARKSLYLRYNM